MDRMIRPAVPADCTALSSIYNHYITNTAVTFEEEPVSADEIESRLRGVQAATLPWLVAEMDQAVVGYAYATKWKGREAYRLSVETSVYLHPEATGRQIGTLLYRDLLSRLRAMKLHVVIGGIALPNPASIALHERFGFAKVAHFREVGFKFNRWIDVGYWQLCLDGLNPNTSKIS
jgi:phosphinothricin acetyltransferase